MKLHFEKKNTLDSSLFPSSNKKLISELAAALVAGVFIFLFIHLFVPVDHANHVPVVFPIEQGEGVFQIASKLEESNLIHSKWSFTLYAVLTGRAFNLQSGDYLIAPSLNAHTIIQKFTSGDVLKEHVIIQEGWDLKRMAQYFEDRKMFSRKNFLL